MVGNINDIELKLISGAPLCIDGVSVHSVSIKEISIYGYSAYMSTVRILCLDEAQAQSVIGEPPGEEPVSPYMVLISCVAQDEELRQHIIRVLSMICRDSDISWPAQHFLSIDGNAVPEELFSQLQSAIRLKNNVQPLEAEDENPENEKARQLLIKRKKYRSQLKSTKPDEEGLNLGDLVSILASGQNLPIDTITGYDLYQFNDQFSRMSILKEYDVNIEALLHGAKQDSIDLKHWMRKIQQSV